MDPAVFTRLTSITRFEIFNQGRHSADDWTPLQRLSLEELIVIDASALIHPLEAPGSFKNLRKLHIQDVESAPIRHLSTDKSFDDSSSDCSEGAVNWPAETIYLSVDELVEKFTHLEQISSMRAVFDGVDTESWKLWQEIRSDNPDMITYQKLQSPEVPT